MTARSGRHVLFAALTLLLWIVPRPARAQSQTRGDETPAAGDPPAAQAAPAEPSPLDGFVFGIGLDGYYAFNANEPVGRINLLRAYDVSSNSFSLNQADVIVERAPNVAKGRRAGLRLDLMYGQATETLQGSAVNEPRPQVYRNVFQAYGSYVIPAGTGLQVDFGKFASALGFENNYTKDQINYSRSYYFNFLPFYHFGFRTTYAVNDRVTLAAWVVNGAQQSEDFNGFKSVAALATIKPAKSVTWSLNYYTGHEGRDLAPALNPGLAALPTQPGLSIDPVTPDEARLHIFDTYVSWTPSSRLTLAGEADHVTNRDASRAPQTVSGGAGYFQYAFTPAVQAAARAEYFADSGGLFSGLSQHLKETTLTATYQTAEGVMLRGEWRLDWSDRLFFLGSVPGARETDQQTLTVGLVWWFGTKRGAW